MSISSNTYGEEDSHADLMLDGKPTNFGGLMKDNRD